MHFKLSPKHLSVFIGIIILTAIGNHTKAQSLEIILNRKAKTEKDLWKKERLNYYLNSETVSNDYPESYFYRGQEKMQKGLWEEAISDFKKSITNDSQQYSAIENIKDKPSKKTTYLSISVCYQQLSNIDSAIFFIGKSIAEDKYFEEAYLQKAVLLFENNKIKQALDFLDESELIFPSSKKIYLLKSQIFLQQGKINKARQNVKKSLKIDPDFEAANILLASIYLYSKNDISTAMRILDNSIKNGTKPILSLYYRGIIYAAQKKNRLAYHDFEKAYLMDTINSPLTPYLVYYDYKYKNFERANRLYYKLWQETNTDDEGELDTRVNYKLYEIGYFLQKVVEKTIDTVSISVFNSFMKHSLIYISDKELEEVKTYYKKNQNLEFARRLNIYAHMKKHNFLPVMSSDKVLMKLNFEKGLIKTTQNNAYSKLIEIADSVLTIDSTIMSMYWATGYSQIIQGRLMEAAAIADKAITLNPTFVESYKLKGMSYLKMENFIEAEKAFKVYSDAFPLNIDGQYYLAYTYFKNGKYQAAIDINNKLSETGIENGLGFENLAIIYEMKQEPDSALKYYKKLSDGDPLNSEYTRSVAGVYKTQGNYKMAMETLQIAKKRPYSDFMLIVDIADLYFEMENYEDAIINYKKAFKKDDKYTYAAIGIADSYAKLDKYKEALDFYNKAIELNPSHAYTFYAKGLCYFTMGKYVEASKDTYHATQLHNEYSAAYQLLADSYFMMGRYSLSSSFNLQALKSDPGNTRAFYGLAAAKLAGGDSGQAEQLYNKIIEQETEQKSEAYNAAIDRLNFMIKNDINSAEAANMLEKLFIEK